MLTTLEFLLSYIYSYNLYALPGMETMLTFKHRKEEHRIFVEIHRLYLIKILCSCFFVPLGKSSSVKKLALLLQNTEYCSKEIHPECDICKCLMKFWIFHQTDEPTQ